MGLFNERVELEAKFIEENLLYIYPDNLDQVGPRLKAEILNFKWNVRVFLQGIYDRLIEFRDTDLPDFDDVELLYMASYGSHQLLRLIKSAFRLGGRDFKAWLKRCDNNAAYVTKILAGRYWNTPDYLPEVLVTCGLMVGDSYPEL